MAEQTYRAEAIVLGKTKLGESNLILRMLATDGSLIEAVASGARKPKNASSARLELFNHVDMLLMRGRSLDMIKETRLVCSHDMLHVDPAYGAAASTVAEFASKEAQPDLAVPRLFDLTVKTMDVLADAPQARLGTIVAANLFKASALGGMRPSFSRCVVCGCEALLREDVCRLSLVDGGIVCQACAPSTETECVPSALIAWAERLLKARFDEMGDEWDDRRLGADLMALADRWVQTQWGMRLKSIKALAQYCAL